MTINGSGFTGANQVFFGPTAATINPISDNAFLAGLRATQQSPGTYDVTVVGPGGTSATSPADQFTYQGSVPHGRRLATARWGRNGGVTRITPSGTTVNP